MPRVMHVQQTIRMNRVFFSASISIFVFFICLSRDTIINNCYPIPKCN